MAFSDDRKFLISWLVIQTWSKKIIDTVQEQENSRNYTLVGINYFLLSKQKLKLYTLKNVNHVNIAFEYDTL